MVDLQSQGNQSFDTHRTVWMVANKTTFTLFETEALAQQYVSRFPASIGGGMWVSSVPVFGAA